MGGDIQRATCQPQHCPYENFSCMENSWHEDLHHENDTFMHEISMHRKWNFSPKTFSWEIWLYTISFKDFSSTMSKVFMPQLFHALNLSYGMRTYSWNVNQTFICGQAECENARFLSCSLYGKWWATVITYRCKQDLACRPKILQVQQFRNGSGTDLAKYIITLKHIYFRGLFIYFRISVINSLIAVQKSRPCIVIVKCVFYRCTHKAKKNLETKS